MAKYGGASAGPVVSARPVSLLAFQRTDLLRTGSFPVTHRAGGSATSPAQPAAKSAAASLGTTRCKSLFLVAAPRCTLGLAAAENTALVLDESDKAYYREVREAHPDLDQAAPGDFYELLGLELDATKGDIKAAYRSLQRVAHPDIAGDGASEMSMLLNSAYRILMNDNMRAAYDVELKRFRSAIGTFDGRPTSNWAGPAGEQRAMFVDESTCIGCKHCTLSAPNTFFMEELWGRARVHTQWGDEADDIREAVEMCPVDCIYFVRRKQLALLEFVMKACAREDVAVMARRRSGNMGSPPAKEDPFNRAEVFLRHRAEARLQMDGEDALLVRAQDEVLAAGIARAWLMLPQNVRLKGWPSWEAATTEV